MEAPKYSMRIAWISKKSFILLLLIVLSSMAAFGLGRRIHPDQQNSSKLRESGLIPAAECLNFGEVWESCAFVWRIHIENPLDCAIEIEDFATSCNCTTIEPPSLFIPAREKKELRLILDLTASKSKMPESEWRDFQVTIWPILRGIHNAGWTVAGRVHTALRLEQAGVEFGRHSEAAQPLGVQRAYLTSFVPLKKIDCESTTPRLQVKVNRTSDNPHRFEVVIMPSRFPRGPIEEKIHLIPHLADNVDLPPKTIVVIGRIVSDFQVSPPEALFGGRCVGDIAETTLSLYSLTNVSFQVIGQKTDGEGLSLKHDTSGAPIYHLRQRIMKLGQHEGRVAFQVRTKEGHDTTVEDPVSYLGTPALAQGTGKGESAREQFIDRDDR